MNSTIEILRERENTMLRTYKRVLPVLAIAGAAGLLFVGPGWAAEVWVTNIKSANVQVIDPAIHRDGRPYSRTLRPFIRGKVKAPGRRRPAQYRTGLAPRRPSYYHCRRLEGAIWGIPVNSRIEILRER